KPKPRRPPRGRAQLDGPARVGYETGRRAADREGRKRSHRGPNRDENEPAGVPGLPQTAAPARAAVTTMPTAATPILEFAGVTVEADAMYDSGVWNVSLRLLPGELALVRMERGSL